MGVFLSKPCLTKVVDRAGNEYCAAACACINGKRGKMEDAHMLESAAGAKMSYFGVFDGHGGDECSRWLAEHLPAKLRALKKPITAVALENLCQQVDEEFPPKEESGSTGTFCLIRKSGTLQIVNVGDSRILQCRQGKLLFATEDHKPDNEEEKKRILSAGGGVSGNRVDGNLAMSRAFGDWKFKVKGTRDYRKQKVIAIPDVTELKWEPEDVIILACDGVFEKNFSNNEVCEFVKDQMPKCWGDLAVVASRVCDEAIRRGSEDNISCMIVQMTEGASKVKQFGAKSFVPGPPFDRKDRHSRECYEQMAKLGECDIVTALQKRYHLLQAKEKNTLASEPPIMRMAFEMSDEEDLATEVKFFGSGPGPWKAVAYFKGLSETK